MADNPAGVAHFRLPLALPMINPLSDAVASNGQAPFGGRRPAEGAAA